MTIFKIHSNEAYSAVLPHLIEISIETPDRKSFLNAKDSGESIKEWWVELEGVLEGRRPIPDAAQVSDCHIVLSPKAYKALQPHLSNYGEFLAIPFKGKVYQMFRCLNRIDKVDTDNSRLNEYNDALELRFIPGDVERQLIWTTAYGVTTGLFCGEEFKKIIEDNKLTGLTFNENLVSVC